ncbi:hypothetical protein ABTM06_20345, partial [Acinetobacter baumannii]
VAKLAPFKPPSANRKFGALRGVVSVRPEFFESRSEQDWPAISGRQFLLDTHAFLWWVSGGDSLFAAAKSQ